MSDIVKLEIKIAGSDSFREVEVSVKDLAEAIDKVKQRTHNLNEKLLNANQIAQLFDQVTSAVQGLQSAMRGLTDAYGVQAQAEARLEQVMRNTMGATDAEIQSIKDLAAAQQELGIVGDEVQLSAAQELATYLEKKSSLEKLIPVMNDMIAQQLGYNATAESAVPIATMMGKVMEGQVKALSRYGYSFTEAQEEILKFGTEEERAATLAEVVEQSVGGVNAAMAATDYGKIVQASNAFGDMKERIGSIIAPAMNVVDWTARISISIAGLGKGAATVKGLTVTYRNLTASLQKATAAQRALNIAAKATVFGLVAAAVAGLVAIIAKLAGKTGEATNATKALAEAQQRINTEYAEQAGRVEALTSIVHNNNLELETRQRALEQLKGIVPDYHADLTKEGRLINDNTSALDRYLANLEKTIRAKTLEEELSKSIADQMKAERELKAAKAKADQALLAAGGDATTHRTVTRYNRATGDFYEVNAGNTAYGDAKAIVDAKQRELDEAKKVVEATKAWIEKENATDLSKTGSGMTAMQQEITGVESKYNELFETTDRLYAKDAKKREAETKRLEAERQKEMDAIRAKYKATEQGAEWERMSYAQLGDAIKDQKKVVGDLAETESDAAKQQMATLQAMQQRHHQLGVALGLETEHTKGTTKETVVLGNELTSLKEINAKIAELEKQRLEASKDEIKAIDMQIDRAKRLKAEFEGTPTESNLIPALKPIAPGDNLNPQSLPKREKLPVEFNSSKEFSDYLTKLNEKLSLAPRENRAAIMEEIALVQRLKDEFEGVNQTVAASPLETFTKGWGGIKGIGNSIRDIKSALTDTDNAWDALTQTVDGFLGLIQGIQAVVEVIKGITAATEALGIAKKVETEITKEDATAKMEDAAAGAASSVASTPVVGAILAVAAIGSVIAALTSLPKFANGGLVYGPTVGLMGEYGGASSNPEVIAPLSRLRALLGTDGPGQPGEVKFRIEGRELVGIINKQTNINHRSR